jgi:hypothetical protein
MKKTLFGALILITSAVWMGRQAWSAQSAGVTLAPKIAQRTVDLGFLPPDLVVPPALPANLDDPILIEAWIRLYNHTEPLELWDANSLTGRDLAQFLLEQDVPLVWDVQGRCRNASCSFQYCATDTCTYEDGQPGVDPIYLYPLHAADMPTLVATLAHESFHRMQFFGPVHDTRFEEFWACKVGAAFNPQNGHKFGGYDPMVAGYLLLWIRDNGLTPYYALPDYPPSITAELARQAAP